MTSCPSTYQKPQGGVYFGQHAARAETPFRDIPLGPSHVADSVANGMVLIRHCLQVFTLDQRIANDDNECTPRVHGLAFLFLQIDLWHGCIERGAPH